MTARTKITKKQAAAIYDTLVAALVARRHELGLTQMCVDQIAGFAEAQTAKYEVGVRRPSGFALAVWCASLNGTLELVPGATDTQGSVVAIANRKPWAKRRLLGRPRRAPVKKEAPHERGFPMATEVLSVP